jgi:uncharacterized protein (DUF2249 family)
VPSLNLQLDVAHPDEALRALTDAFAELAPGDALIVDTAGDPRKLTRRFCDAAWGQFDWVPLQAGDGLWRNEVRKRSRPAPATLSAFLEEDHRRCDGLFAEAEAAALDGDAGRAGDLFARLDLAMRRHLTIEEEGLFPELDRRMGYFGQGPIAVMREEHDQMRGVLTQMAEFIADGQLQSFAGACETLLILMEQHNLKEEEMLYPVMDEAFAGEQESLLKQLILY